METDRIDFSESITRKYDRYLGPLLFEPYALDLAARIDIAHTHRILELACGTGRLTRHLREVISPQAEIIATDSSIDMLEEAKFQLTGSNISWEIADAQDLHFENNLFDLVVCQFGIKFIHDKAKAFNEIMRVLRPGGCFLFNTWNRMNTNPLVETANTIINSFFRDDPPLFLQLPYSFYDESIMRMMMQEGGFHETQISLVKKEGSISNALEAAVGLVEGNPVYSHICARDASLEKDILREVEKKFASRFGTDPLKHPMQAWVCQGWK